MSARLRPGLVATIALLLAGCALLSGSGPATARAIEYELRPAQGWHVTGQVSMQRATGGDRVLLIAVSGPAEEVTRKFVWHVAALRCDEWGTPATTEPFYYPGTRIRRVRVLYRTEDRFLLDSDRRRLSITTQPDWLVQPFSVSAFININGTGRLVTCADLPAQT